MDDKDHDAALRREVMSLQVGAIWRDERVRLAVPVVLASVYFVVVLFGSIESASTAVAPAVPAALSIVWLFSRPGLAVAFSALGVTLLIAIGVAGAYVPSIVAQFTVLIVVFVGAANRSARVRWGTIALVAASMLGVLLWSTTIGFRDARDNLVSIGLPVALLCLIPFGLGSVYRQFAAKNILTDELRTSMARERDAEREIAVEQERNRVAREVHDIVAHSLAVVIMQADGARYAAKEDPSTVEPALENIAETAREALTEVRTLLHELRHSQGKRPAPALIDIDSLVASMRELGLTVDVAAYGHQRSLGDSAQLAIYRIAQEALTNALRHGDTTEPVGVDFDWGEAALTLTITNALRVDGVPQIDGPGHGIPGMRERAALAGGELNVGVGNRGMFRVRATLPVPIVSMKPSRPARAPGSLAEEPPKRQWSVLTEDEVEVEAPAVDGAEPTRA